MTINQQVYDVIELSRMTKIPFMFVSNPGYGKTTAIRNWALENGYHLECLIGSRSTPEELLGYQVNNGGTSLEHLDSQWWSRIIENEKKGIHSVLFCDEISTCSPGVQGSMFSLILDRENNKGEKLPESCVIIAAGNYARNLSNYMDILSPTLNRFCIVNLTDRMSGIDITKELFHPTKALTRQLVRLSDEASAEYDKLLEQFFTNLFIQYSDKESSKGYLDINNTNLEGLYQNAEGNIYNFLSLRSMSDMRIIFKSAIEFGITEENFVEKMVDGLIGCGTNSFYDEAQALGYRVACYTSVKAIINKIKNMSGIKTEASKKASFDFGENSISNIVSQMSIASQAIESLVDGDTDAPSIDVLNNELSKQYGDYASSLFKMDDNKEAQARFLSDYESVGTFLNTASKNYEASDVIGMVSFLQKFDAYYSQLSGHTAIPDVNKQSIFANYKSSLYKCSMVAVRNGYNKDDVLTSVKSGDIIEVGVRRLASNTLYKIPYGSSVYTSKMGTPADTDYSVLMFENGKLVEVSQPTLAELNNH